MFSFDYVIQYWRFVRFCQLENEREWSLFRTALRITFQGDDFAGWIHDGWIGRDRSFDWIGRIGHVDDDDEGRIVDFLSNTDELVRLHRERTETDVCNVDANILKLEEAIEWTISPWHEELICYL